MHDSPTPAPRWVVYPTLIASAFVLDLALANKIEPAGFARSFLIAIGAGAGMTLVGWGLTRDRWLGGLVALAAVLATISLIPIFFAWRAVSGALGDTAALALLGGLVAVALGAPLVQRLRVRRGAAQIRGPATYVLNRFAAILVVVTVVVHAGPDLPGTIGGLLRARPAVVVAPPDEVLPDIYVILVDGYPRADVLARRWGIQNGPFLDELSSLGLDVAERSHSNYTFTPLTLASLFQMKHLDEIDGLAGLVTNPETRGTQVNALRNAINTAPAFAALEAAGYEVVVTMPGYEHVALRDVADRLLDHGEMNDLERDVLKRTWLLDILSPLVPGIYSSPPHDRVVHAFGDVEALAEETRDHPIFAWIHLPVPHLPIVLGRHGEPVVLEARRFDGEDPQGFGMTDAQFAAAYADELAYLNERLVNAVRMLQADNKRPDPVIVVMSDHGYNSDLDDLQARFGNFFAAYTPRAPGLLADDPTPVNVMARILNRYLGTEFRTSPDRFFVSPSGDRLLPLLEVSDPG